MELRKGRAHGCLRTPRVTIRSATPPAIPEMAHQRVSFKDMQPAPTTSEGQTHEREASPAVVFDKVSFAFDDHVVLRDVSFTVPRASMRILLGASGAGKSVAPCSYVL